MAKNKNISGGSSYESVLKQATTEKVSFFSLSKIYPAYITLFITLSVTFGLWRLVDSQVENENNTNFDKAVTSIMNRFEGEYQKDYQVLTSVRGLYDQLPQVVRDYFELYASIPTATQKSLLGVIYSPRVFKYDLELYYYNIRSQGLWDYIIIPQGNRDEYYPIQFIVPDSNNRHLSGYDYGTVPTIKNALFTAFENNKILSTPVFKFRKDTAVFFLISPIYKKGAPVKSVDDRKKWYEGSVMLEIDATMFFKNSLGTENQSDKSVIFQVFNFGNKENNDIIFQSDNAALLKTDYTPELYEARKLKIADKEITVKFSTIPNFGGSFQKYAPILTLVVSLLLSGLAFAFIVNVINRKQSALSLAERMTRSQRRIVESSNDIIAVLSLEGVWKSMNPASAKILRYEPDELVNQNISKLFTSKEDQDEFFRILDQPTENLTQKIDIQMSSKTGEKKWVSWSLSVSRIEGLVYTTGRDVTLDKISEEQDRIRNKQVLLAEQLSREASEFKSNFFAKLSLQLRNSLTGILGYLDLISFKAYETDDEHDSYIDEATKSSREILSFVMDTSSSWGISDVETGDEDALRVMTASKLDKPVNDAVERFNKVNNKNNKFKITVDPSVSNHIAVMESKHLASSIKDVLEFLTEGIDTGELNINSEAKTGEDITIINISAPHSDLISEMMKLFNDNENNLIDTLKIDKKDLILRFAVSASNFRMLNGKLKLNPKSNEVNIVSIELQNKVQQEEKA